MKTILSQRAVAMLQFDPADKSNTYFDEVLRGFAIRVYPTGSKRYLVKFQLHGRQNMKVIGDASLLSFEAARAQAAEILEGARSGSLRIGLTEGTMAELCEKYMEEYAKPRKKTWKLDEGRIRLYILPALGAYKISKVTDLEIETLLTKIAVKDEKPYAANRLQEQLIKMFDLARKWRLVPQNHYNPAKDFEPFPEKSSERFLSSEELRRLISVLDAEDHYVSNYFKFLIYTGIRRNKALEIRWADISIETKMITVTNEKHGGKGHYPITPELEALLNQIQRQPDNPWVFCSKITPGDRMRQVNKRWERIRKKAGLEDVRIHDLRHTVGSNMAQAGESLQVIGKCLGHKSTDSTEVYAHLTDRQARAAFDNYHQKLQQLQVDSLSQLREEHP